MLLGVLGGQQCSWWGSWGLGFRSNSRALYRERLVYTVMRRSNTALCFLQLTL
jgi:hypothetical protein